MDSFVRAAILGFTLGARACGEDAAVTTNPPAVQGSIGAPAVVVAAAPQAATRGGTVVTAGPAQLEVVSHVSGQVYAYPTAGIVAPSQADVTVNVSVQGGTRPVPMRWSAREGRYVGRVEGVTVIPGPTTVTVVLGGAHYVGVGSVVVIAPAIVVDVVPVVEVDYHHGKHKHRGHGRGHGNGGVRVRLH